MIPLLLDALAVFRLTKLVVDDVLLVDQRDAIVEAAYVSAGRREAMLEEFGLESDQRRPDFWAAVVVPNDADPPKLATLVTCPWCAGMWVALGAVAARHLAPRAWRPLARALAFSAAAGIIAERLEA